MRWLFDYFTRLAKDFLCYFFQKQPSKDHLTQGNLLKTMLLNEKQSNLEKEMHENISLYSQYFSPEAGGNPQKTYFHFLKLTKKVFYFIFLDQKSSTENKIYTWSTQNRLKLKSPRFFIYTSTQTTLKQSFYQFFI